MCRMLWNMDPKARAWFNYLPVDTPLSPTRACQIHDPGSTLTCRYLTQSLEI
jgi:hypothetical protein